jgi:hypothetical protein
MEALEPVRAARSATRDAISTCVDPPHVVSLLLLEMPIVKPSSSSLALLGRHGQS